jgi:glycerol-1-phosphate dehydrogenase [NAD(P)+]
VKYAAELCRHALCLRADRGIDGRLCGVRARPLRDDWFQAHLRLLAPVAIVADLDVIATAPSAMAGWGYGDLVGKFVAGADWMSADALGVEALNPSPFAMVQNNLAAWLGEPAACGAASAAPSMA